MQIEKYYQAVAIRREIEEIKRILNAPDQKIDVKIFEKLSASLQKSLSEKTMDVIKKELLKVIKQKEKEFSDL